MADSTFPKTVLDELVGHCLRRGTLDSVNKFQAEQSPGNGVTCSIWVQHIGPARSGSGMSSTSVRVEYGIRLYTPMLQAPKDAIDENLLAACADLMMSFTGAFTLGGVARAIDLLGAYGRPMEAVAGYARFPDTDAEYRVMTITLPVVVNDVWDQAG